MCTVSVSSGRFSPCGRCTLSISSPAPFKAVWRQRSFAAGVWEAPQQQHPGQPPAASREPPTAAPPAPSHEPPTAAPPATSPFDPPTAAPPATSPSDPPTAASASLPPASPPTAAPPYWELANRWRNLRLPKVGDTDTEEEGDEEPGSFKGPLTYLDSMISSRAVNLP